MRKLVFLFAGVVLSANVFGATFDCVLDKTDASGSVTLWKYKFDPEKETGTYVIGNQVFVQCGYFYSNSSSGGSSCQFLKHITLLSEAAVKGDANEIALTTSIDSVPYTVTCAITK